jgi:hypothetical protein
MKTQLLQDIDESNPEASSLPIRREPTLVEARPARSSSFAEQWRQAGLSRPKAAPAQAAPPPEPEPVPPPVQAVPPAEAPVFSTAPEPASEAPAFSFDPIEGLAAQLQSGPGWYERWGRKAASWSLGLAGLVLLAGGGVWVYNESKLERTLAAVAKSAPQVGEARPAAAPPVPAPAPVPAALAAPAPAPSGPQLVMLNEAPAPAKDAAAPPEGVAEVKESTAPAPQDVAEVNVKDEAPAKVASKRLRSTRATPPVAAVAAAAPRKLRRDKVEARVAAAPVASERASQMALTLKQCRIEGYAAQQCLKRGCVLTKYGLACRG